MLRAATPVLVASLILGGVSGAVVASLSSDSHRGEPKLDSPAPKSEATSDAAIEALKDLKLQVSLLVDRVAQLERRTDPVQVEPFSAKVVREEVAALAAKVDRLSTAPSPPTDLVLPGGEATPALTRAVEKSLKRAQRKRTASKWRMGLEKRQARIDDRLGRIRQELGLDLNQVDNLRKEFTEQERRSLETIRLWEMGDEEGAAQNKTTNHEQHQNALTRILSSEQLQRYRQGLPGSRGGK